MTSRTAAMRSHARGWLQRAWQPLSTGTWLLIQQTAAATAAWAIAKGILADHDPFFAPIAAVVALNTFLGGRGSNALRLLQGVVVGIVVGELSLVTVGSGYGGLAIALFVAMAIARATGGARVTVAQAAVGAILTVAVGNGAAGIDRLADALIGAGVALVFTQFLFSPEPLRLLRRAESAALAEMANGIRLTGQALAGCDDEAARRALDTRRTLRDRLTQLTRIREVSIRVARHSVVWRRRIALVVREKENAGHLDLLGDSCLMLIRVGVETRGLGRGWLAPHLRELAGTLSDLSRDPGGLATRQGAVARQVRMARELARDLSDHGSPSPEPREEAAVILTRSVAADIMIFCGAGPGQAADAVLVGGGQLPVAEISEDRRNSRIAKLLHRLYRREPS